MYYYLDTAGHPLTASAVMNQICTVWCKRRNDLAEWVGPTVPLTHPVQLMSDCSFTHGYKKMDSQGIAIFMYQSTSPQNAPSIEDGLIKTIAQPTLPAIRALHLILTISPSQLWIAISHMLTGYLWHVHMYKMFRWAKVAKHQSKNENFIRYILLYNL